MQPCAWEVSRRTRSRASCERGDPGWIRVGQPLPDRLRLMTVARSILLFLLAAVAEIGGAWLIWQGVREHRGLLFVGAGVVALGAYGFVATLQPDANFGRILAAYGGVFVAGSLAWGMLVDGFRPDRWDVAGGRGGRGGRAGVPGRGRPDHVRAAGQLKRPRIHASPGQPNRTHLRRTSHPAPCE